MNTNEMRELNFADLDLVSGGQQIELHLPGRVNVQLNTDNGCWAVWLAGKYTSGGCGGKPA